MDITLTFMDGVINLRTVVEQDIKGEKKDKFDCTKIQSRFPQS